MKIFFSYGHDEYSRLVVRLKKDLEKNGYEIWLDSDELKAKHDWEMKLEDAINNSEQILFFITPHSSRRPDGYCLNELSFALYNNKPIIPAMIKFTQPPLSICRLQWLDLQSTLDNESNIIEEKYAIQLTNILSLLRGEKVISYEGQSLNLVKLFDPIDFSSDINRHVQTFVGREWIIKKIDSWLLTNDNSKVFWITAPPGYGKSALSAMLANTRESVVGIHFCQYNESEKKDPNKVIQTLSYQLATQVPKYQDALIALPNLEDKIKNEDTNVLFNRILVEPLKNIEVDRKFIFVIDALDEASENEKNILMQVLYDNIDKLPLWLKFVVTSRPEAELLPYLRKFNPYELNTQKVQNNEDLLIYINKYLTQDIELVNKLIANSEGNILYLKEIIASVNKKELSLDDIDSFPVGLGGIFFNYFTREFADLEKYRKDICPVLELLVSSKNPLTSDVIEEVLNIDSYDLEDTLDSFGTLILSENGKIKPFHKSMFDWLIDKSQSGQYRVSLKKGNERFAKYFLSINKHKSSYITQWGFYHSLAVGYCDGLALYYENNQKFVIYHAIKVLTYIFKNNIKELIDTFRKFLDHLDDKLMLVLLVQFTNNLIEIGDDEHILLLQEGIKDKHYKKQFDLLVKLKYAEQISDYDKAQKYASKLLKINNISSKIKGIAYYYLADTMRVKGTSSSYKYFKESKELLDKDIFFFYWMQAGSWMADQAFVDGDAIESKKQLHELLMVSQEKSSKELEGTVYRLLGQIEHTMENYKEAEKYFQESIKLLDETNQRVKLSLALNNLAQTYAYFKPEHSREYFEKSRNLSVSISYPREEGKTYYVEAEYLINQKKYDEALKVLEISEQKLNKIDYKSGVMFCKYLSAYVYLQKKKYKKAFKLSLEVLEHYYERKSHPWLCIKVYDVAYKSAEKIEKTKKLKKTIDIKKFKHFKQYSNFTKLVEKYVQ